MGGGRSIVRLCGWGEIYSEIVWVGRSIVRLCGWMEIFSEIGWVGGDL